MSRVDPAISEASRRPATSIDSTPRSDFLLVQPPCLEVLKDMLRNKRLATVLTVCFISLAVLIFFSVRKLRITQAQSGEPNLMVLIPSFQYNTLKQPTGLALLFDTIDGTNGVATLYIADSGNHVIRRFPPGGPLTTIGAMGSPGYVDGPLSNAKFNYPTGLTGKVKTCQFLDPYTNSYRPFFVHTIHVSDSQNYVVRMFCVLGAVTPWGPPQGGCYGGGPCNLGYAATVCGSHNKGMVDGSSSSACFATVGGISPYGKSGYYIADAENHAIRKWDGSNVSTVAGNGSPGFADGNGSAARFMVPGKTTKDSYGYLYVADIGNNAIRKIDSAGNVSTPAGAGPLAQGFVNGSGPQAKFYRPTSIVFNSSDGMFYIADSHNNVIRRMDLYGTVTTYAGTGAPGLVNGSLLQAQFDKPTDLVIHNGFMYVSDTMNNVIRRIDMLSGTVTTYIT